MSLEPNAHRKSAASWGSLLGGGFSTCDRRGEGSRGLIAAQSAVCKAAKRSTALGEAGGGERMLRLQGAQTCIHLLVAEFPRGSLEQEISGLDSPQKDAENCMDPSMQAFTAEGQWGTRREELRFCICHTRVSKPALPFSTTTDLAQVQKLAELKFCLL